MKLKIKKLEVKKDKRGTVAELIRSEDVGFAKFGQALLSTAKPGQAKGGHYHKRKKEWFCVIKGKGLLSVSNPTTGEEKKVEMGEENMVLVEIPIGCLHTIENAGEEDMYLLAYTNEAFDPSDPDVYYE